MSKFINRNEAGRALSKLLLKERFENPLILALPRGGVPIAYEVAKALNAPLDLVMVRKIGVPIQPELAVGAVVNGDNPVLVINKEVANFVKLSPNDIEQLAKVQLAEIKRRRKIYLKGRGQLSIKGKTVIIVDDGIATGSTARASIKALKQQKPAKLILATPVASASSITSLSREVDDIFCLKVVDNFIAISAYYEIFTQVSDKEVMSFLKKLFDKI